MENPLCRPEEDWEFPHWCDSASAKTHISTSISLMQLHLVSERHLEHNCSTASWNLCFLEWACILFRARICAHCAPHEASISVLEMSVPSLFWINDEVSLCKRLKKPAQDQKLSLIVPVLFHCPWLIEREKGTWTQSRLVWGFVGQCYLQISWQPRGFLQPNSASHLAPEQWHQCSPPGSTWVKRDFHMQLMLWGDLCIRVLRGWVAQHPVHILDASFKDTQCVSCLPAGRRQEAASHWLMWWLRVQRMGLSHPPSSMSKDSSHCGTGTPNTGKHLRHAQGHDSPWATWERGLT